MDGGHESLVRSVVAWGRLTGAALTVDAAILVTLFVVQRQGTNRASTTPSRRRASCAR